MRMIKNLFVFVLCSLFLFYIVSAISPSGVTDIISVSNSTAPADPAGSVPAIAGNVTELNIQGYTTTQTWQGYFGNVTGTIELTDGNNNTMYNWSLASPKGEIYASTNNSISWTNIQCFDLANDGDALEAEFGIESDDVDGVNETFNRNDHALFYTNSIEFGVGDCNNTKVYGNGGVATFDEVLMTDGVSTIFASLLQEDTIGFDGRSHDFQMLVLEDGHGTDTSVTPYYFWVELE